MTTADDMPAPTVLFRSNDLLVRRVARGTGTLCYVTFDSYTDVRRLDRPGFGEDFLLARAIDAVHVIQRDNLWYQHPELPEALAAVKAATAGYATVIAYGSSMGGFAALHYGAACGASIGIAISPQFSIDPRVAPFEDRWSFDASRIAYRDDRTLPLPTQYVVFDPRDRQDRAHYDLFAARSPTIGIEAPHAGHPAGGYLHEAGMFALLFESVHDGTMDVAAFQRQLRERRRQSGQYFFTLSRRTPGTRLERRIRMAEAAVTARPDHSIYRSNLGGLLDRAGRHEEALVFHRDALARDPANLHIRHALVRHHELTGDLAEAERIAEDLVSHHPGVLLLRQTRIGIWRQRRTQHAWGRWLQRLKLGELVDAARDWLRNGSVRAPRSGPGAAAPGEHEPPR